jgi:multiple sugar transport system ATP-binding protein
VPDDSALTVRVELAESLGSEMRVVFLVRARPGSDGTEEASSDADDSPDFSLFGAPADADGRTTSFTASIRADPRITTGTQLRLLVDPGALHFFDPDTGLAVGPRAAATHPQAEIERAC